MIYVETSVALAQLLAEERTLGQQVSLASYDERIVGAAIIACYY